MLELKEALVINIINVFILYLPFNSFYCIFLKYQGGLSDGYKAHIVEKEIPDETYKEDGVALFRIQGSGPDNMQAIQVEPVCHTS